MWTLVASQFDNKVVSAVSSVDFERQFKDDIRLSEYVEIG